MYFHVLVSPVTRTVQVPMKSLPFNYNDPVVISDRATPAAGHWLNTGEAFFPPNTEFCPHRVRAAELRSSQPTRLTSVNPVTRRPQIQIVLKNKERPSRPPVLTVPEYQRNTPQLQRETLAKSYQAKVSQDKTFQFIQAIYMHVRLFTYGSRQNVGRL